MKRLWGCLQHLLLGVTLGVTLSAHAGAYEDFFFSVTQDNPAVIEALISRGFDPNTVDESGQPGLLLAIRKESVKVARLLAQHPQVDIEFRTAQDESALMLAALRGYVDICEWLIARDADVNKPGWTPLHYAATKGHVQVMQLLLDKHAYIDAQSPNGSTPLMMSAMYGTLEAVEFLLKAGADAAIRNDLGLSAVDFAKRGQRPDAETLLADWQRKLNTGGSW